MPASKRAKPTSRRRSKSRTAPRSGRRAASAADVAEALRLAGCVAADEEAVELIAAARDEGELAAFVARRCAGESVAWITGHRTFCGIDVVVHPGVYVPRWQTEAIAEVAAAALPPAGAAVDLCSGSGAVAAVLRDRRPAARVVATDLHPAAVACARANGVDARLGDLFAAVDASWRGTVDVVVAVTPYVPTAALGSMSRSPEPLDALHGGRDGLDVVRRVVEAAPQWLRPGGALVLELGRPQANTVSGLLLEHGFARLGVVLDGDGDVAGMTARFQVSA